MKTEKEIRAQIEAIKRECSHLLGNKMAKISVDPTMACQQDTAIFSLNMLYWVLGESRPKFECDEQ